MKGIAKLAHELGVSTATVSRALNGKSDVNQETRNRVLEAAARLGYAANASARSLARGSTNQIGFMIELNPETATSDSFFMGVFDGVQSVLIQHDLELVVLPCPTSHDPYPYLQRFVARNAVDAMIISATQRIDPRIELLQARSIPFVAVGRSTSGSGYSWVDLDFEGLVHIAVDRFVSQGHRRIAVTVPPTEINFAHIIPQAYRQAMRKHGLTHDSALVIKTTWNEQGGYDLADTMFGRNDPPTAALVIGEMSAIGLYRRLRELRKQPGRDLAIIAFRDEPAIRFLSPSVTRFQLSLHDVGVGIAEAVLAQLPAFQARYPLGVVQKRWPVELIPGESDGPVVVKPKTRGRLPA